MPEKRMKIGNGGHGLQYYYYQLKYIFVTQNTKKYC
jgi:hypothetical protein